VFYFSESTASLDWISLKSLSPCSLSAKQLMHSSTVWCVRPLCFSSACIANPILPVRHYRLNIEFILNEDTYKMEITTVIKDMEVEMPNEGGKLDGSCYCRLRKFRVLRTASFWRRQKLALHLLLKCTSRVTIRRSANSFGPL
jgi:hypothetical protein